MASHELPSARNELVVLSDEFSVCAALVAALRGWSVHSPVDVDQLLETIHTRPCESIVIDNAYSGAADALQHIANTPFRSKLLVILLVRDPIDEVAPGADIAVVEPALVASLAVASPTNRVDARPIALERLIGVSMLAKSLDRALEHAADELAGGFGVDRCLISVREDSSGSAASGTRTWSSLTWSYAADRCRAAARAGIPFIAPVPESPTECETYLAVPLATAPGANGFLGLVVTGPRSFRREVRTALDAAAARIAAEVSYRSIHERASEELDRLVTGPGNDPLLGTWNQVALKQLTAMQLSSAKRNKLPFVVAVLDIVDLQGINHRYGLETGDRVLRRLADAVRATVREEDVVGRWAGDAIAIVLHGIGAEGGQRVAERVRAALAERPLELAGTESLVIPVTVGLAMYESNEDAVHLLTRAANAAKNAQAAGEPIAYAGAQPTNPRLSGEIPLMIEDIASTIGGAYRLLHEISRGGMGVVYRAQDRALERPVAIKMLRPDLAEDPELVERFRIEAAMLAHIRHPNLVQIYSFGHTGGDSYFVMELVEGESLEQACERHVAEGTAMPLSEAPQVIAQIAAALDALHERGIVHRDVKPANVIRDPFRNRSVLVDVGIARRYGQDARSAGTPGFIAPEIFGGGEASVRSDVYGLAATVYAMLTLARPWGDGELATQIARQCANVLRPPSELRPELAAIDEVLMRALDADPDRRQASAGRFANEVIRGLPVILPRERQGSDPISPLRKTSPSIEVPRTRGVVFRSVARTLGAREAERLRDALNSSDPELAQALADCAPLEWIPTALITRLFAVAPVLIGREPAAFARDVAKVTVRGSFRRFFPASAATLVPESTLSAIRSVWSRYHNWGDISSMPVQPTEHVVRLGSIVRERSLCAWTAGMLEQLIVLSGAKRPAVAHDNCRVDGHDTCLFRVSWEH